MRHAVILSAVLFASPLLGQGEPLPPVTPRAPQQQPSSQQPSQQPVLVALAVEPIREEPAFSLEDAARANDYVTFHALFEQAPNAAYAPLHELWTHSINDPIGAFYGEEMYERFSSRYPEFAAYIDEHKIVDDRGNVFYPTSETRQFLLARAIEGRTIAPSEPIRVAKAARRSGFSLTPPSASKAVPAPPPPRRVRFKKAEAAPLPAPAVGLKPNLRPAPVPVPVSAPLSMPVQPRPVMAATMVPEKPDFAARGILLVLIGLVGIGFLALMLRAPGETAHTDDESAASDLGKAPQ
ncbi:MAG TPA: hypothetical protein VF266_12730 [Thermoanaerobaculia bacterium]